MDPITYVYSIPALSSSISQPLVPEKALLAILPITAFWIASLGFHICDKHEYFSKYRLHTPEEFLRRNIVPKREAIKNVLIQQSIQIMLVYVVTHFEPDEAAQNTDVDILIWIIRIQRLQTYIPSVSSMVGIDAYALSIKLRPSLASRTKALWPKAISATAWSGSESKFAGWELHVAKLLVNVAVPAFQYAIAVFAFDSWQFLVHYTMHKNKWLYRNMHSRHHRLYVPYAFGAQYSHPGEAFINDHIGSAFTFKIARLSTRQAAYFFTVAMLKSVDDHCGYRLPWDPFTLLTDNNSAYHDIHHQTWGMKSNFSQPFTSFWDRICGTRWTDTSTAKNHEHRQAGIEVTEDDKKDT
ncbi:hypothetical protein AJ79_08166 [Helicocarpus griseus UAMH5409]|uniref:Fatty acid hydroxylase domain-containing protein n=1 Tax=Helicocarpus griseus UAMH5409 TaxID=1447875 RepID=A0A2B7WVE9_9EURO|nr:hypothetical protein AJ79_08166 [Helicocarpus griseus UAMH5409]